MMDIDIDDLLEPVRGKPPTAFFVFPFKRELRVEFALPTKANSAWLNAHLSRGMRPREEKADDADYVASCHADVDAGILTKALMVGWALKDGDAWKDVEYTPALGADLLHKLIDAPQGLCLFDDFRTAIYMAAVEAGKKAVDPTEIAGNSDGG